MLIFLIYSSPKTLFYQSTKSSLIHHKITLSVVYERYNINIHLLYNKLLQSLDIPGLLYFVSGGLLAISAVACVFLEETRDKDLEDILPPKHTKSDQKQIQLEKL